MMTTNTAPGSKLSLEQYPSAIRETAGLIANYDSQIVGLSEQVAFLEREADKYVLETIGDSKSNEQTRKALKADWLANHQVYPHIDSNLETVKGQKALAKIQLEYLEDSFQVAKLKMQLKIAELLATNPAAASVLGIAA